MKRTLVLFMLLLVICLVCCLLRVVCCSWCVARDELPHGACVLSPFILSHEYVVLSYVCVCVVVDVV